MCIRDSFSADFDWCIRIMKKAHTLHNTRLTIIDYLDEGMTCLLYTSARTKQVNILFRDNIAGMQRLVRSNGTLQFHFGGRDGRESGADGRLQTLVTDKGERLVVAEDRTGSELLPNSSCLLYTSQS